MKATFQKHILNFKNPAGTSRGILKTKETFVLTIEQEGKKGVGECALFRGLSADDVPEYEEKLNWTCQNIHLGKEALWEELIEFPSIQIGVEQAFLNLELGDDVYFSSDFTNGIKGIPINGLIWMGDISFMKAQIEEKLKQGFRCLKLKIGTHWKEEYKILMELRNQFPTEQLEIRVDANGAFSFEVAKKVLDQLFQLQIHSIEQPIQAGNISEMITLCKETPTPIALDEELIGIFQLEEKKELLQTIQSQYIILKPSLVGGFKGSLEWIELAENQNIKWWITSALESNIGLNAIAQFTSSLPNKMPQGLGTGGLFTNNFPSKLEVKKDRLWRNV